MIPTYRAKKIDSDEYVEGYYFYENIEVVKHDFKDVYQKADNHFIHFGNGYTEEIDQLTLAIHFPDMIDSEGTKIFASLSEDGKGGDNLKSHSRKHARLIYKENTMQWDIYSQLGKPKIFGLCSASHLRKSKVTGIQE